MRRNRKAGQRLRQLRKDLNLSMRDVHERSDKLASRKRNSDFRLAPSRLSDIECRGIVPNIFRLFALANAYDLPIQRLLALYDLEE